MNTLEPAKGSIHLQLIQCLRNLLAKECPDTSMAVFHCDSGEDGRISRFAGLERARIALAVGDRPVPTLVVGIFPPPEPSVSADDMPWLGALLAWPGFAYLPYGFSKEELLHAARRIIKGAKEPLPPGLLPERADILRVSSEVRHWLENRRRNVESIREDFVRAAHGEIQLHHSHLDPVMAISEAHQRLLRRLWRLEPAAGRFAPKVGGLAPMKVAVDEFTSRWLDLEAERAALKTHGPVNDAERLTDMVAALNAAARAIDKAVEASRMLDAELLASEGK